MRIGAAYLRLSMQENGKKRTKKAGEIGRGAVYVFVNPCFTDFVLQLVVVHRY
jgi:hypothetical protein